MENGITGTSTLGNWLLTPTWTLQNGVVLTFYTRTVDTPSFADRLQVRMSTNGTSTNVGASASDVGDFTTLLLDINPTYVPNGYPSLWYAIHGDFERNGVTHHRATGLALLCRTADRTESTLITLESILCELRGLVSQRHRLQRHHPPSLLGRRPIFNQTGGRSGHRRWLQLPVQSTLGSPLAFKGASLTVDLTDTTNFTIVENTCGPNPVSQCTVSVVFNPRTAGRTKTAQLIPSGGEWARNLPPASNGDRTSVGRYASSYANTDAVGNCLG